MAPNALFRGLMFAGALVLALINNHVPEHYNIAGVQCAGIIPGLPGTNWEEAEFNKLDVEQKCAQVVFPLLHVKKYLERGEYTSKIQELINSGIGGFILTAAPVEECKTVTAELQKLAKIPLLFCADLENGLYSKEDFSLQLPTLMAWGAANDSMLTYKAASSIADLAAYMGVHMNLSPVSDVITHPDNAVISVRSFGDDPAHLSNHMLTYLKAMKDKGIIGCVKHFPGHGATSVDSHYGLPLLQLTLQDLENTDLLPFKNAIAKDVPMIMTGHLSFPKIDSSGLPASLSSEIIGKILRGKMGYNGVVISDALVMSAVQDRYSDSSAALLAFKAGTDILLYPDNARNTVNYISNSLKAGVFTIADLDSKVKRILHLKEMAGLGSSTENKSKLTIEDVKHGFAESGLALCDNSITLLQDPAGVLNQLRLGKKKVNHIVFFDPSFEEIAERYYKEFQSEFKLNSSTLIPNKTLKRRERIKLPSVSAGDVLIVSAFLRHSTYTSEKKAKNTLAMLKQKMNGCPNTLVISLRQAQLPLLFGQKRSYINTYGYSQKLVRSLAEKIKGTKTFTGHSPVKIEGIVSAASPRYISVGDFGFQQSRDIAGSKFSEVESLLEKAMHDSVFPGCVALAARHGRIVFHKAFGRQTYNPAAPAMELNTIFDLASVSKVIATTTAAMILVSEGKMNLDDKVIKYIPQFNNNGKDKVKLLNLMLHNSGLPAFKRFYQNCKTPKDVLDDIYKSQLTFAVGSKTVYSDLGMITLGKVIEKITGKTLDEFCRERIFIPLGMSTTMYNPPAELKNRCAPTEFDNYWRKRQLQGEVHDEASAMLDGVAGHAGLFSTATDLSRLLLMLMNNGEYEGRQFIKPEVVEKFTTRYSAESSRAIGWDTKDDNTSSSGSLTSIGAFGHTGYTGTSVWCDRKNDCFMILLTNRVYPTRDNTKIIGFRPKFHDALMKVLTR